MLTFLFGRRRLADSSPDWRLRNEAVIVRLRQRGVSTGENCVILTEQSSLEPHLMQIGNRVAISGGTIFLTHDGAA